MAMSIEFKVLIDGSKDHDTENLIRYCQIDYFSYWKVLYNFSENFGAHIPVYIKSRISEIENQLLLEKIWQKNLSDSCEVEKIFQMETLESKILIKNLHDILAHRVI